MIFTQIEILWTVNRVWIHRYLQNNAQSLKWDRRGALLFFEVIHQISRSHEPKIVDYTLRIFPPAIDIIPTLLAVVYSNGKYTN